jgi:hypothetical protein
MPQCNAERDLGPGCGVNYCVRELGHDGDHRDYKGHWFKDEPKNPEPRSDLLTKSEDQ